MVGTTGVVSAFNYVYVANNKVITRIDYMGETKDISHQYDWITSLAASQSFLFGIYHKDGKDGIFSYDLNTEKFKSILVTYVPMNLIFKEHLRVFDQTYGFYTYTEQLAVIQEKQTIPSSLVQIQTTTPYLTMGCAANENDMYFTYENKVIGSKGTVETIPIEGTIMSIQFYQSFLFIVFISVYNQYSVSQYDMSSNLIVKTIEGGYVSGPPIYTCIYDDSLYISASVNSIIHMETFEIASMKPKEKRLPRTSYPMFELTASNPRFLESTASIDAQTLKQKLQSFTVTTEPAESSQMYYYIWLFIALLYLSLIVLTFMFQENRTLHIVILIALFVSFLVIIKNRVSI